MVEFFILMKNELVVIAIIFFLLFVKIGKSISNDRLLPIIQLTLLLNFVFSIFFNKEGDISGNMFQNTPLFVFEKSILNLAVYIISLLCSGWLRKTQNLAEFFILLLSALLGMFLMISSGNLLMFYLSLELATIPVAAMANFDLERRRSSEGAMKLILSSAFSSGILLFGISLIYGASGSIGFTELSQRISGASSLEILAFVFFFTGLAFKLSIVPFHLWTADVYEGSPIATTSFLSVVSKGAVAFIMLTILYKVFHPLQEVWYNMLVALSVITMIIGNLFAIRQQNIKRFLAFSSIAQVGFILAGMSSGDKAGITATVYFILIYLFSNLAAFGVADVIANRCGKENIDDYKGLYGTNTFLSWMLTLALFSLAGIPPTAGFFGKLFLITAAASKGSYWFITVAALNMVISLYYYLRIVGAIFMGKNENPIAKIKISSPVMFGFLLCGAGIIFTGFINWIYDYILSLTL
ncbi:MAG: NADH-quinone oxidoreductase subunit N [Ginsengibacter sp.]